jgi:methylenetetrahydrofolate reductase (NADPH)
MDLKSKILNPQLPVVFFEMVPPAKGKPQALEATLRELARIQKLADAINLPEIHDESRGSDRTFKFVPRIEPRLLGGRIRKELGMDVVVNRCVVYEKDQAGWFRETEEMFGIQNLILVGGESSEIRYPGPNVIEAAREIQAASPASTLGGISIPSRALEVERLRRKVAEGLCFFTTQVLFDSNDIVWLIQRLNGVEARIFLSFAPVTQPRDIEFLRWLGVDVPSDLDRFLIAGLPAEKDSSHASEHAFERSLNLAKRILMDVFDNLPPDPPPLGINIEHINRRNFDSAVRMLEQLRAFYSNLLAARRRTSLV